MDLAICMLTGRAEPRLDWLVDAIAAQAPAGVRITLIVIDALAAWDPSRTAHSLGFREHPSIVELIHRAPKPNAWAGQARLTDREWWHKPSGANTALVVCPPSADYIAFVDDRAKPGPRWLETIYSGSCTRASVLAGTYERIETRGDAVVTTYDHRIELHPAGLANCGGGWLFGCTMALPLAWALEVNGFEEGMDGLTFEDCVFGLNLENSGRRIELSPSLFVSLDRTGASVSTKGGSYAATDKGKCPNNKSHAALARFKGRQRTEFTPDLRELRRRWHDLGLGEAAWPRVDPDLRDWYDGEFVRDMKVPVNYAP